LLPEFDADFAIAYTASTHIIAEFHLQRVRRIEPQRDRDREKERREEGKGSVDTYICVCVCFVCSIWEGVKESGTRGGEGFERAEEGGISSSSQELQCHC
jgi:hypothetical protein